MGNGSLKNSTSLTLRIDWGYERLDGSTEQSEREKHTRLCFQLLTRPILGMPMIDRFHKDPDTWIFLISTLAGGTGLNLVGANKVVIFGGFPITYSLVSYDSTSGQIRIGVSVYVSRFLGMDQELNIKRSGS